MVLFYLKRDSGTRFFTIFLLKIFDLGRIRTDKNGFAKHFVFAEIFDRKSSKILRQRSKRLRGHPIFSLDTEIFIFQNYNTLSSNSVLTPIALNISSILMSEKRPNSLWHCHCRVSSSEFANSI